MTEEIQEVQSVPKAVLSNAIPAMLAMVMVLIYNMADLFFIGQTGDDLQVAAISMATPMFLLFMSLGNVFGIGGASLISRNLGSGNEETVGKVASLCFWCCTILGISLSVMVFLAVEPIVVAMGSSAEILDMVASYLRILSVSGVFILISSCYSALLRAEGKPEKAMVGMMLGNLINIVLDPVFILWLDMGVEGAGLATLIGNVCGGGYYLLYLFKGDTRLSIKLGDVTFGEGIFAGVLAIGIPASLSSILMGSAQVLLNSAMAQYGDMAVAGVGVAMKCTMITTMVCIGIGMGIQPLLGYAIGAKEEERYHAIFKFSMFFAFCVSGALTILCYVFLSPIVNAFVTQAEAYDYAYKFSAVLISTSVIVAMLFVLSNALQSAGAVKSAFVINISRQGIFFLPLLAIMGTQLGMDGVLYAQPVADVCTLILSAVLYLNVSKTFFDSDEDEDDDEYEDSDSDDDDED